MKTFLAALAYAAVVGGLVGLLFSAELSSRHPVVREPLPSCPSAEQTTNEAAADEAEPICATDCWT